MKILSLPVTKLRNMELANFTANVISINEQNNPTLLKLIEVSAALKSAEPNIYRLVPSENLMQSPSTYSGNRSERKKCVLALKNVAKGIYDINAEDKREYIQLIYPLTKASFSRYYLKNIVEQNEIVRQYLYQIDTTPALTEAIEALGMQSEIEQLRGIHSTFTDKYETSRKTKAGYVRKKSVEVKAELCTLLSDYFSALYLAQKHNKDIDYTKLIGELNAEIQRVKQIVAERTPAKKKAAVSTTATQTT